MIRIHMSPSAGQAKRYYTQSLGRADYYARDGASPGLWFGQGAERLGLSGPVAPGAFVALIDNRHPATGERLSARDLGGRRRPGWDIVFSPPKAVSVLRALTGDERIGEALLESAKETLAEIEQEAVKTRLRRQGQRGAQATGNLVASLFVHDTTRELADGRPDPHDHIHAYVHNLTWAPHEGRWQAAELYDVHIDRPYYEGAFEARLAGKLAALGLPIERQRAGWTIGGVPETVVAKMSRRTSEIEAAAERLGITDAAEKGRLGARTRRGKADPIPQAELRNYWADKLTAEERLALSAVAERSRLGPAAAPAVTVSQAIDHAIDHLFARDSTVPAAKLLAEALRYGVGAVEPDAARAELAARHLPAAEINGRLVLTTDRIVSEEARMLLFARDGRGCCDPLGGYGSYTPHRDHLSTGQARAARQLLGSFDRVQLLTGKAGTGKSTLLAELRDGIAATGRRVQAVAPTTSAVGGLRRDGFEADTVALLLTSEVHQQRLAGAVLIVDEAGLVGTQTMGRLFELAEKHGTRVILVGDSGQHRGVERGVALQLLEERAGLKAAGVHEILRQTGRLKEAVAALARGEGADGFDRLAALGAVREITDAGMRYRQLAEDYADVLGRGKEALIISPTHREGAAVTEAVRAELRRRGQLQGEERMVERLVSADLTEAQRRDPAQYAEGDVVQWVQNARGWVRGERARVIGTSDGAVRVMTSGGEERELPLAQAERFQVYRPGTLALSVGDRVRVTQNGYTPEKKRLVNGAVYTVAGFTPGGDVTLENGWVVPNRYGHLAPGFVVTSHAAQGRTVHGTVFLAQSADSLAAGSTEQFYVSMSRAKGAGEVRIYTDDAAALRRAVSRSDRPLSATELLERRPAAKPAWAKAVERLRRAAYAAKLWARLGLDRLGESLLPEPAYARAIVHPRR